MELEIEKELVKEETEDTEENTQGTAFFLYLYLCDVNNIILLIKVLNMHTWETFKINNALCFINRKSFSEQ